MKRSWCNLIQNVYRRSLRPAPNVENRSFQVFETRKDSTVHVSLSSSSLVKQPGVRKPQLPKRGGPYNPHSTANDNRLSSAVDSLIIMRSLTGTTNCLGQGANAAPRSVAGL